jgi:predicted RecA/RadA family phage recombinase
MNNYQQAGDVMTCTAPYTRTSGQAALIGSMVGVAVNDVTSGAEGEFRFTGVFSSLAKATGTAWTKYQKLYWDDSNKRFSTDSTVGQLAGVAGAAADSADATGTVRLNGTTPATAEGPQSAIASLTDNGGGTADGTVASQAAPTTLTDSTGLSGTHDDTLAATTVPADITGGESPTEAEHNALLAVTRVIAQNASDTGQKVIEMVTLAGAAQNNLKELTTKVEAILVALRAAGIIAT